MQLENVSEQNLTITTKIIMAVNKEGPKIENQAMRDKDAYAHC